MKRLLCLMSNMNAGGAETFLMKIYRTIDRTEYQLDFCINVKEKCFHEDEIYSLGGRIFRIPSKSENIREFKRQLTDLIKREKYEYVLRITSNTMGFYDLKIAKKAGARRCCARSSNSSDGGGLKAKLAHLLGRVIYGKYVDVAIAPSDLAALYTFGKEAYNGGRVHILHNAVDLDIFRFDEEARDKIRREFGIDSKTKVLGHVGRFMEQKNHMFLAEIFKYIKENDSDTVLLLVGEGSLKEQFEKRAVELGIRDRIIFTGVRSDIPALLSAMDVFVFPSLYEGMPNTVIEAQATGLPCVIADTITREADVTGLVDYLPLSAPVKEWGQIALNKAGRERLDTKAAFVKNKYDIKSAAEAFVKMVFD